MRNLWKKPARAFKISGYNYHQTKKELVELKNQDPDVLSAQTENTGG